MEEKLEERIKEERMIGQKLQAMMIKMKKQKPVKLEERIEREKVAKTVFAQKLQADQRQQYHMFSILDERARKARKCQPNLALLTHIKEKNTL